MGNSESYDAAPSDEHLAESETLGYRVLGVQPNSPATTAGLVSFFDFLVGCDGRMLLSNDEEEGDLDFVQILKDNVGKRLELLVYNIKSQRTRLVNMTPQKDWGGKGLIGVTIRLDDYGGADERLIRVLSVEENSPAAIAGLNPMTDYLLGTAHISFASDVILGTVLEQHEDKPVEFYVYSTTSDKVRVVTLLPTFSWGGDGLLGAEVGMGYLHRLPSSCRETDGTSVEIRVVRTVSPKDFMSSHDNAVERNELVDLTAEDEVEAAVAELADAEVDQSTGTVGTAEASSSVKVNTENKNTAETEEKPAETVSVAENEPSAVAVSCHTSAPVVEEKAGTEKTQPQPEDTDTMTESEDVQPMPSDQEKIDETVQRDVTAAAPVALEGSVAEQVSAEPSSPYKDSGVTSSDGDASVKKTAAAAFFSSLPPMPAMPFRSGTYTPPLSTAGAPDENMPPPPMSSQRAETNGEAIHLR